MDVFSRSILHTFNQMMSSEISFNGVVYDQKRSCNLDEISNQIQMVIHDLLPNKYELL